LKIIGYISCGNTLPAYYNEDEETTSALSSTGMTNMVLFNIYHPKNAQFS